MAPHRTTFAPPYAGWCRSGSTASVTPGTGGIAIDQQTLFAGSAYVLGGLWVGFVQSDPDIPSITVAATIRFDVQVADVYGLGYGNASLDLAASATGVSGPARGVGLGPVRANEFAVNGFVLPFWSLSLGRNRPALAQRALTIPKPQGTPGGIFAIGFALEGYTGGGPAIDARLHVASRVLAVTVDS
jgi:hypothetical protein